VDQQGWLNNFAMTWQIATTIAIVATILSGGHSHAADSNVWEIWRNRSGWAQEDFGYVVLTGLTASLFSFSGYEAGAHMAEETRNASTSSPWGLIATTVTTSLVGLLYILGLLYAVPAEIGLFTTLTAYGGAGGAANAASLYAVATGNRVGLMLTNVLIANLFFAGVSSFTVTSRIGFAMARDGAFPYGPKLAHIWGVTKSPVGSVVLVFATDCLLLLLPLTTIDGAYGPVAFYAVMSICVIGCACVRAHACACMRVHVCRRLRGHARVRVRVRAVRVSARAFPPETHHRVRARAPHALLSRSAARRPDELLHPGAAARRVLRQVVRARRLFARPSGRAHRVRRRPVALRHILLPLLALLRPGGPVQRAQRCVLACARVVVCVGVVSRGAHVCFSHRIASASRRPPWQMNYTIVVVAGVFIFAGAFWLLSARKTFTGPKRVDAAVFKAIAAAAAAAEKAAAAAAPV
jgi:hypothetical protein